MWLQYDGDAVTMIQCDENTEEFCDKCVSLLDIRDTGEVLLDLTIQSSATLQIIQIAEETASAHQHRQLLQHTYTLMHCGAIRIIEMGLVT